MYLVYYGRVYQMQRITNTKNINFPSCCQTSVETMKHECYTCAESEQNTFYVFKVNECYIIDLIISWPIMHYLPCKEYLCIVY